MALNNALYEIRDPLLNYSRYKNKLHRSLFTTVRYINRRFTYLLTALCCTGKEAGREMRSNEYHIKRKILRHYDRTSRPVRNDSSVVNVLLAISLSHILDTVCTATCVFIAPLTMSVRTIAKGDSVRPSVRLSVRHTRDPR